MTTIQFIQYAKKFLVALAAALAIVAVALADGKIEVAEWITIALAFLSALGVYGVDNATKKELGV